MEQRQGEKVIWFRDPRTRKLALGVLLPLLLLAFLFLPPTSLGERLFSSDYVTLSPSEGGTVSGPEGAHLDVPPGALAKRSRLKISAYSDPDLQAMKPTSSEVVASKALPEDVIPYKPLFSFSLRGESPQSATLSLPVPYELASLELADLYAWDGTSWSWVPSRILEGGAALVAELTWVPEAAILVAAQPSLPRVALGTSPAQADLAGGTAGTSVVNVRALSLGQDGGIVVNAESVAETSTEMLAVLTNEMDGVVRSDLVDNMLISDLSRTAHVQEIVRALQNTPYHGLELAYRGIDANLRGEFSTFVDELAQALHTENKVLVVRLDAESTSPDTWGTGAYDWRSLGTAADLVRVSALDDPAAYVPGGAMDDFLRWVTSEVNRRKVDLTLTADSHAVSSEGTQLYRYGDALGLLSQRLELSDPDSIVMPGQTVRVTAPDLEDGSLVFETDAQQYVFATTDASGAPQTVWLENASSIARKLQYVSRYALGGISLDSALEEDNDPGVLEALAAFHENLAAPEPQFAFVWTIENASGRTVARAVQPVVGAEMVWTAPNNPGNYIIRAQVSDDGGTTGRGPTSEVGVQIPTPTLTPTPRATNTPTATPTSPPTNTPPPQSTRDPNAVQPTAAPPVVAAGRTGGYFGYGIQVDMMSDGNHDRIMQHIRGMGFGWVKQQVEWFRFNPGPGQYDWGALDRLVDSASTNGINVMLSVVKAPRWARPAGDTDEGPPSDPNTYGTFMRELAARYKGRVQAYEIWNEQNLYYEWGGLGNKLSAARYIELLKVAYNAVKAVDPNAVVISGALTPTGVNDGNVAIDDRTYLEQMYQAGLARYCDAVGAHPSGYNNPPDAEWTSWSDPNAPQFKGHPSFFFRGTMESYRNIMVKYGDGAKRVWATEFGWASVENLGVGPAAGYAYAADNSEAEQAAYLVRAYQMGKAWGWAGPMFLWNLNFAPVSGAADEKAAFGIVRADWSQRPSYAALANMPK
ncbi:MAG: cellulase family glycosylhydrolase [Anaerolineae bacterium]